MKIMQLFHPTEEHPPVWLHSYDPDANGGAGGGIYTVDNPQEAMVFPDAAAAFEFYRQPSKVKPLREDGRPNRPLTAYTVSIEDAPS